MTSKTDLFRQLVAQVEQMPEQQRQRVADGSEQDENFILSADDFATDEAFTGAVVAEIMKLLDL